MDETLLQAHVGYMIWADRAILEAVQGLTAPTPTMISTLQHMYRAEVIWISRLEGNADAQLTATEAPQDLPAVQSEWSVLHHRWEAVASSRLDWSAVCTHYTAKGLRFDLPRIQILLHVVNHATMHRGQVTAMIRAEGVAPPNTDLIGYYRSLKSRFGTA